MVMKKITSGLLLATVISDNYVQPVELVASKKQQAFTEEMQGSFIQKRSMLMLDEIDQNQKMADIAIKEGDRPKAKDIVDQIHSEMAQVAQDIRVQTNTSQGNEEWIRNFAQKVPQVQSLEKRLDIINNLDPVMDGILNRFNQMNSEPQPQFNLAQQETTAEQDVEAFLNRQQQVAEVTPEESMQNAITSNMFKIKSDTQNHFLSLYQQAQAKEPVQQLIPQQLSESKMINSEQVSPLKNIEAPFAKQAATLNFGQAQQAISKELGNNKQGKQHELPKIAEQRPEILNQFNDSPSKILVQVKNQTKSLAPQQVIPGPLDDKKQAESNLTQPQSISTQQNKNQNSQNKMISQNKETIKAKTVSQINEQNIGSIAEHGQSSVQEASEDDIESMPSFDPNDTYSGLFKAQ